MIDTSIHLLLLLLLPPLLMSVIVRTKAWFGGRAGAPLLQPYYDLAKLMRKGVVISRTTTWVFIAGPVVSLACVLLAGSLVPLGPFDAPIRFTGDLLLFAYLLGLSRFFTTLAALDTGSSFEGMGAAREVTFACLAEPATFFTLLALARLSGSLSLTGMLHGPLTGAWYASSAPRVLLVAAAFIVLLAENCRIPFDDPNTHLELTMIHEVMVLDHSGPLLGLVFYGAAIKLFVLEAILLGILAPFRTGNAGLDWLLIVGGLVGLSMVIGVVESIMGRLRLRSVPNLLIAACLLSAFGFLLLVR